MQLLDAHLDPRTSPYNGSCLAQYGRLDINFLSNSCMGYCTTFVLVLLLPKCRLGSQKKVIPKTRIVQVIDTKVGLHLE